jgi:hypothetical protein
MMQKNSFKLELRAPKLRAWLEHGVAQLVERVRSRVPPIERIGVGVQREAQRFGSQAWGTIAARWPAIARERKVVHARYRRERQEPTALAIEPLLDTAAVEAMIAQLTASSDWQARASAAISLAHVGAEGVIPALVSALRDRTVEVAVAAVDALASHEDATATAALLSVLQNAEAYFSPMTRVAAISGLARRLPLSDFGPILQAVRDFDAEVSIAAMAVIAERAPTLASEHLLPVVRDTRGFYLPLVRLAAASALERAGCLNGQLAADLMGAENDPAVRRVFARASHLTQ